MPWVVPCTPGYPQAIQSAGTVVAPLLAGFSTTLVALLLDASTADRLQWPNQALVLLVLAATAFIATVQTAVSARTNAVTPDELRSWHPDLTEAELRVKQAAYVRAHDRWADRTLFFYRAGVTTFLAGIVLVLVPAGSLSPVRAIAIAVVAAALVGELVWIALNLRTVRRDPRYAYRRMTAIEDT